MTENKPASENNSGCLLRLYWMMIGNVLVLVSAGMMAKTGNLLLYGSIYVIIVATIIIARYLDIRYFAGQKADVSGPATMGDWKKYTVAVTVFYLIIILLILYCKFRC